MAIVAATRIKNIVSVTQGDTYKGIRGVNIAVNKGRLAPVLEEGNDYPTDSENMGTDDYPVRTDTILQSSDSAGLAMQAQAKASLVIVKKKEGGAGNETVTNVNHEFGDFRSSQRLQQRGEVALSGVAHSADGTTLPISTA